MSALEIAETVSNSLEQLGFCRTVDNRIWRVNITEIVDVPGKFVVITFDVASLPPKVRLKKLIDPDTLHQISTALGGKPVKYINTVGLKYVILLDGELPVVANLDESSAPQLDYVLPIGVSRSGPVWKSIYDLCHILIGGASQSGKSTWLKTTIVHAIKQGMEVIVVDPKKVGFTSLQLDKLVTELPEIDTTITNLITEMDRRAKLFEEKKIDNFRNYHGPEKPILLIVDEFTDLALQAGVDSQLYKNLIRLASMGAAFGIFLILATQNPKAEIMNTLLRSNMTTRIAFRVAGERESRIILEEGGAEKIPQTQKGRFLFGFNGKTTMMQGYLYSPYPEALTPLQMDMIRYSVYELKGKFAVGTMHEKFKDRISYWEVQRMAEDWESRNWLQKTGGKTSARVVTDVLKRFLTG